eukprot:c17974_g1_i1 orf=250-2211(-)
MPPLAHPQPSIPGHHPSHQRLRCDSIDLACSSGSSSFFARLWPNRRKFAPSSKRSSVGSAQETICESSKPSSSHTQAFKTFPNWVNLDNAQCNVGFSREDSEGQLLKNAHEVQTLKSILDSQTNEGLHCKESDSEEASTAFPKLVNLEGINVECRKEVASRDAEDASRAFPKWVNLEATDVECRNELACRDSPIWVNVEGHLECRGEGSEGGFTQLEEVGVKPIMESLKGVVINKQRIERKKEGEQKVGTDQMLMKRLASSKAGEVNNLCGVKKMRMSTLCELQRVVGTLQWGRSSEERWLAADEVRRLCKDDPIARVTLGFQLGAIPPLISMLHSLHPKHQCTALLALLNLAVGNDVNKAAIVKAKAVPRMAELLQSIHTEVQAAALTLFLSLSAFDGNKAEIGASESVALLVTLMGEQHTKKDALRTLYNLSIHADSVKYIVDAGGVPPLLAMVSDVDTVDKSLATLSNFVGTDVGRHALGEHKEVAYTVLIDAMRCMEMPKCQERAVYVLMMIAHNSQAQRQALAGAGAIPALVELSLLGSALAQKRATRTLDSFRCAKAFSAPQERQCRPTDSTDAQRSIARTVSGKKVVDGLVQQSLNRTMQRITRRANLSTVLGDSMFAEVSSVTATSSRSFYRPVDRRTSSCSLPY